MIRLVQYPESRAEEIDRPCWTTHHQEDKRTVSKNLCHGVVTKPQTKDETVEPGSRNANHGVHRGFFLHLFSTVQSVSSLQSVINQLWVCIPKLIPET